MATPSIPKWAKAEIWLPLLVVLASAYLLFKSLDGQPLWQDEAETALLGRTVLQYGIPKGTDGLNFFSQLQGREYGTNMEWKITPWVQCYLVAGSFALLGEGTFAARLPFVLFGLLCLLMAYRLARLWFGPTAAIYALVVLAFSVSFLLLSRQCRYYAPAMFFVLVLLEAFWRLNGKQGLKAGLVFGLSLSLLMHSHYVMAAAMAPGLLAFALIYRSRLKPLLIYGGITALLNLPYFLWFFDTPYTSDMSQEIFAPAKIISLAGTYVSRFFTDMLPWLAIALPAALALSWLRGQKEEARGLWQHQGLHLLLLACVGYLLVFAVVVDLYYLRYASPLIPLGAIIVGLGLRQLHQTHPAIPMAMLGLWLMASPMQDYLKELSNPVKGPIGCLVEFLNSQGKAGDRVMVSYGDQPIKLYTPLRVYSALSGEDYRQLKDPEFIVLRSLSITNLENEMKLFVQEELDLSNYRLLELSCPDTPFENREDPREHYFKTQRRADKLRVLMKNH